MTPESAAMPSPNEAQPLSFRRAGTPRRGKLSPQVQSRATRTRTHKVYDGGCEGAGGEEQDRASVVASCDPLPVLEAGEHVRDLVAQAIEFSVVRDLNLPAGAGRNTRENTNFY